MRGLLLNFDRDSRLSSTLTCSGLRSCCSGGGAGPTCCSSGGAGDIKKALRRHPIGIKMEAGFITGCEGV